MNASKVTIGGSFSLTDHFGRQVSDLDYRGRLMMIFFGFTHCRRVCPETLAKLSLVLDGLGANASRIAPVYITVDTERDDTATMQAFLEVRYPRFTGLTGSREAIDQVRAAYKVYAEIAPDEEDLEGYAVPHSALVYITDEDGQYLTHFNDGAPPEKIVARLSSILEDRD